MTLTATVDQIIFTTPKNKAQDIELYLEDDKVLNILTGTDVETDLYDVTNKVVNNVDGVEDNGKYNKVFTSPINHTKFIKRQINLLEVGKVTQPL